MAEQDDTGFFGKNTWTLRELHGESRETLGRALNADYHAVRRIEMGKKGISKRFLVAVSEHYMVSEEELVNEEIPHIEVGDFEPEMVFRRVYACFPFVETRRARRNRSFRKALEIHRDLYEKYLQGECPDEDEIPQALALYEKAHTDSRSSLPAAVNHTALFYLYVLSTEYCAHIIKNRPASFMKNHIDEKTGEIPVREAEKMDKVAEELSSEYEKMSFDGQVKRLFSYLGSMLASEEYARIGDFYIASGRIFNIIRYSNGRMHNLRSGLEWMHSLYLAGNPYAMRFFFG